MRQTLESEKALAEQVHARELEVLTALRGHLDGGSLARTFECTDDERAIIAQSDLLTLKRTIYAANISENDVESYEASPYYQAVKKLADAEGSLVLPISAKVPVSSVSDTSSSTYTPCAWRTDKGNSLFMTSFILR